MSPKKALPFALDTSNEIPKFRAETFWTKEPETIQWIDDNLSFKSKTDLFIDVGANIGIYSLYAAEVNCDVPVFSIELSIEIKTFWKFRFERSDNIAGN